MDVNLQFCRLAAVAMNELTANLRLGNLAEKFTGEDAQDWAVVDDHQVKALKHGYLVAIITRKAGRLEVVVPDALRLIRSEHLGEFDPDQYPGIQINEVTDWKGERAADMTAYWDVPPGLNLPLGPRMAMPRRTGRRKFKVIPSLR